MTAMSFVASLLAHLTDPIFGLGALAGGVIIFYLSEKVWIRVVLVVIVAIGFGLLKPIMMHHIPIMDTSRENGFSLWNSVKDTKYEAYIEYFEGVRNQASLRRVKTALDARERACEIIVGRGSDLFARCDRHSAITACAASILHMSIAILALTMFSSRRKVPSPHDRTGE
jgi:hypothetical protein